MRSAHPLAIAPDPHLPALARFRREAEALARLQHPGIVQVFALADKLGRQPRPPADAARIVETLARAVHAATAAPITEFYANLWRKKLPKLEALRQAQLTLLREPKRVSAQRKRVGEELAKRALGTKAEPLPEPAAGGRTRPALWAAFVLNGDIRRAGPVVLTVS